MTARRVCGRDPEAGPGTCHYWWETCNDMRKPPAGCYQHWVRQFKGGVYTWGEPWQKPLTGEIWPPPPASAAVDLRQLSDARLLEMLRTYKLPDVLAAVRAERARRRRELVAA